MNDRKQHVIKMAHHLFIEKGFQATSIQDILDYSGISKGTFYNYFSSKNELLIALFKMIYSKLEKDRNELLIGRDPSNIEIFIKQIELQMEMNKTNKLYPLFEEVNFSNDADLKQIIKKGQLRMLRWLHGRFIDLFDDSKEPYLLDCAIMFTGILQHNLKYHAIAYESNARIHQVVRYSVERIVKIVNEVAEARDQLINPELIESWLPDCKKSDLNFQQKLYRTVLELKKALTNNENQSKYNELLDFVQDELLHLKNPRKFLLESALESLKAGQSLFGTKELQKLDQLVDDYFTQIEEQD
ncbi:TetR/AcrR family transcriptional regulator [Bacillus sp. FJAT-29790]|uniref:TetR/AcrR family transcriptional regulator n=1 Tax=Bacillus sp. FJAT-29790 TaxID=1895002 RepID=UPI001C2395C2|nr:TetR/AcrR family transcriptional regulator [Bacillus sp. FJAT-29790]MBU8878100.1 TetR/AcrR family transcriptional regulator [Bacillus sp. FJAT-29790]